MSDDQENLDINYGYVTVPLVVADYLCETYPHIFDEVRTLDLPLFFEDEQALPYAFAEMPTGETIESILQQTELGSYDIPFYSEFLISPGVSKYAIRGASPKSAKQVYKSGDLEEGVSIDVLNEYSGHIAMFSLTHSFDSFQELQLCK